MAVNTANGVCSFNWWAGTVHSSMSQVHECAYEWVNADLAVKHFEWLLMKYIIRNIISHFLPLKPSHWTLKSKSLIVFYRRWQVTDENQDIQATM